MALYAPNVSRERAALMRSQRRKIDLSVRRIKGEIVELAVVEATWSRLCASFRSRVLSMPAKLGGMLVGIADANIVKARIEDECLQALAELSEEGFLREAAALPSAAFDEPDSETAAEVDGEPMGRRKPPPES